MTKRAPYEWPPAGIILCHMSKERLVVMVKDPARGQVKTRLAADLGDRLAETLYRCFVADILKTLRGSPHNCTVAFSPPGSRKSIEEWLGKDTSLIEQAGSHLGARMKNLFLSLFHEGCSRVVLMGSDIPDLPGEIIKEAFLRLKEEDGVIGPAADGGYYLIGFRKSGFFPDVFEGIEWSTDRVYEETIRLFSEKRCRFSVLPVWNDVDTVQDLRVLFLRHENTSFRQSDTIACILEHKGKIF